MSEKKEKNTEKNTMPDLGGEDVKTTTVSLKQKIKDKMDQLKDLATMELLLPVHVRMKKRLESIREMSSANSIKVAGHWKTTAPKIHIVNLEGRKLNNNECEIRFGVYDTDEKGNKKLYEHTAPVTREDGSTFNRTTSAEYRVAYEVVETIRYRKPIEREIIKVLED